MPNIMGFYGCTIQCPRCKLEQKATAELWDAAPFWAYVHKCECGYIITESDWDEVQHREVARMTEEEVREAIDNDDFHLWSGEKHEEMSPLQQAVWVALWMQTRILGPCDSEKGEVKK